MLGELTYTALRVAIADFLGWGRNSEGTGTTWSTETKNRLADLVHAGYLQFLYPPVLPGERTAHRWSFLRPKATLTVTAGDYIYDLPQNFGAIFGDMTYDIRDGMSRFVQQVSPGLIDRKRAETSIAGQPTYFAIRPRSVDDGQAQEVECVIYPTPDATYSLIYYYDAKVERLSAVNLYPLGGQAHQETIVQSCRDIADQRINDRPGSPEHSLFLQRLQASVEADRRMSPAFLGYNDEHGRGPCITRHGSDFHCSLKHNLGGG